MCTLLLFAMVQCFYKVVLEGQLYCRKTTLPCADNCPEIKGTVPVASGVPIVSDNINKNCFWL